MTDVTPGGGDGDGGGGVNGTHVTNGAGVPGGPGADAGLAAEHERLARQLRDTRMQLAMTQARLSAVEQSSAMRFGRTVANAARRPWPRGAQLPRDLYRLWRERGVPKSGAQNAATALASAQLTDLAGTGERFLSALTAPGVLSLADPALALAGAARTDSSLVITGALSALGCATLAPDAVVHPLLPHDADVVLEGTGADLVLIEAAAMLPGSPWAYATDPAGADRGRRLARMIVMARSLGKPVVLVANVPQALMPGISWLAAACDAVTDEGLGVQLARFNPVGITAVRPTEPLYAGDRDPREAPAVRAVLDQLTDGPLAPVRVASPRGWRDLPALYRDHAVFVSASAAQAWEQAACGARVVGIAPPQGLRGRVDPDVLAAQIEAARAAGPLDVTEARVALRDIFASHATPARLAAIARAAGLPAGLVGGRQIAVLATAADAAQAGRLGAALLRQRLRPAEVVLAVPAGAGGQVTDALVGLTDHGIRVVTADASRAGASRPGDGGLDGGLDGSRGRDGADWTRPLARLATSPWLAPWTADRQQPDTHLLDLACARECAQADAVGFGSGEYEFTRWLDEPAPALARRDLLAPGGPPVGDWGSHGLRLFTVARADARDLRS